jgi:hypothetical protein
LTGSGFNGLPIIEVSFFWPVGGHVGFSEKISVKRKRRPVGGGVAAECPDQRTFAGSDSYNVEVILGMFGAK